MKNNTIFIIRRGDIFDVDLGKTIGTKQGGIRPCIFVANDKCNEFSKSVHIIPITTKLNKKRLPTHILLKKDSLNNLSEDSLILAEQTELISTLQILEYRGRISNEIMQQIDDKIEIQFDLKKKPDIERIKGKVYSIKELENYIIKQREKSSDLIKILKLQIEDFISYCNDFNLDYRRYYTSKFTAINNYLQKKAV